jgi:hypothetical protein
MSPTVARYCEHTRRLMAQSSRRLCALALRSGNAAEARSQYLWAKMQIAAARNIPKPRLP